MLRSSLTNILILLSFEGIDTNTSTEPAHESAKEPNIEVINDDDVDMMDKEKDSQPLLFAKSIGVKGIKQFDDSIFQDAGNIDKPTKSILLNECKRRNINVPKDKHTWKMSDYIIALQDPSTVTDHTHSKEDIADMKQKVTELYEEARAIVDTDISSYKGMHREDRPNIEVDWTGGTIVEPVFCCEGRFQNGNLLLRYVK